MPGPEAVELGLAARCVPAAELAATVRAIANEIAAHPLPALIAAKQLLKASTPVAVARATAQESASGKALATQLGQLGQR